MINDEFDLAKEELRWAIGYDASKDWQCSNIEEEVSDVSTSS